MTPPERLRELASIRSPGLTLSLFTPPYPQDPASPYGNLTTVPVSPEAPLHSLKKALVNHQGCAMLGLLEMSSAQLSIEAIVRNALALGELSPGAEAAINRVCAQGRLSAKDQRVLEILADAIANNCVRRVGSERQR